MQPAQRTIGDVVEGEEALAARSDAITVFKQCRHGKMVFLKNDRFIGRSLDLYGEYSAFEAEVFVRNLRPGDCVIEAGSNVGAHTLHLARLVGEQGVVYAFEPQRVIYQLLCANLALNELFNVRAYHGALGRQIGTITAPPLDYSTESNFGGISLRDSGPGESVPLQTIDSLGVRDLQLLKIDVEGMEADVIRGARATIGKHRPVLYVENDRKTGSEELISLIGELGYDMWWHLPLFYNPKNFAKNPENVFTGFRSINLVCYPKERAEKAPHLRQVSGADDWWEDMPRDISAARHNRSEPASIGKSGDVATLPSEGRADPAEAVGKARQKPRGRADIEARLREALKLHRQGRLRDAEGLYRAVLAQDPGCFDALNMLGVNTYQQGRLNEAEDLIGRAVAINPENSAGHSNRGVVLHALGRLSEALLSFERAVEIRPDYAEAFNNRANVLRSLNRLDEALASCGRALQINPDYAEAFNTRGNALRDLKRPDEALAGYDRALKLRPDFVEAIHNRGNALLDLKRPKEALASYDRAIQLRPDYVEAFSNRGNALIDLKRPEEALASYDHALALKPDYANAHSNRGNALRDLKRSEDALVSCDRALELRPDFVEALSNRGNALLDLKRPAEALVSFDRALQLRPDYVEALSNRGNALLALKAPGEALAGYDHALALDPNYASAYNNRGHALRDLNRLEEALASYDRALSLTPDAAKVHSNRGIVLRNLKRLDEAVASFDRALQFQPDHAEARLARGMVKLLRGQYHNGWEDYESRHQDEELAARRPRIVAPSWHGENLAGRHIAIHTEQGLGDEIQFARYLPLLLRRSAKVSFFASPKLARLLRPITAGMQVITTLDGLKQAFDFQCALMSLPLRFGTELSSIPNNIPYLKAEEDLVSRWRGKVTGQGFRIGIAWQGTPGKMIDQGRSVPLAQFAPLCQVPNVRLFSLQKKHGLDQLASLPAGMKVEQFGGEFDSGSDAFVETAAIMKNLDLIVTSDTSIAHLAGALGCPTWVALQHIPDWRWLLDRDDSPWYPTMRLFRQKTAGDWTSVFSDMLQTLRTVSGSAEVYASRFQCSTEAPVETEEKHEADNIEALLQKAINLHRQGKLTDAEVLYRAVLAKDPECFDALNMSGVNCYQQGRLAEGADLIGRAIAVNPKNAAGYSNHGVVLHALERLAEALASFDRAVQIKPDYAEAFNNRANVLRSLNRLDEALASCERALELKPDYAEAFNTRGNVLQDLKRSHEALASFERALQLRPDFVEAVNNRGNALLDLKRPDEALASYDRALQLKPDYVEAFSNRGNALLDLKRPDEALASYDRALALSPGYASARSNRGNALRDLNRPEEAVANYDQALALSPRYAHAYNNRGNALRDLKRLDEAVASFDRALELQPDYFEARATRGMVKLLTGRYRDGWADYESRMQFEGFSERRPKHDAPLWQGEDLSGRRIAVYSEQGLGDVIQFARFLPMLKQQGANVTFVAPANLTRLLRRVTTGAEVVTTLDGSEGFDFQCPLLSLPLRFGTESSSIPTGVPYLFPEEDLVSQWRHKFSRHGFKIGIAWQGTPAGRIDRGRSIPLAEFAPLSEVHDVRLISLQKTHGLDQLRRMPAGMKVEILKAEFDSGPDAFVDTAAIMKNLDLIVTSDTSIAHLAGALACPTWLALKYVPDWRWLLDRNESPWYPTMRLFRQSTSGDWASIFAQMAQELRSVPRVS